MSHHAARCPFCVAVVRLEPSFWERIGMRAGRRTCPNCRRLFELRDAHTMGATYGVRVERFTKELAELAQALPMLPEHALDRALGKPHKDDTRLIPSLEELVRSCTHHNRAVLVEMARGREATLDVARLQDEKEKTEVMAILGKTSAESGDKESEQLVARSGISHFVLYTHPGAAGAELRVKRAVQAKVHPHHAHHHGSHAAGAAHH